VCDFAAGVETAGSLVNPSSRKESCVFLGLRSHAPSELRLGIVAILIVLGLAVGTLDAAAATPHWSPGLRVGTAQPGAQQTIKGGLELGLVLDHVTGGFVDFGFGVGYVLDNSARSEVWDRLSLLSVEAHARTAIEGHRPYLELGLGVYSIDGDPAQGQSNKGSSTTGGGALMGGGLEVFRAADAGFAVELGLLYHVIVAEASYTGGNLEDYYALSATFRWGAH